MQSVQNTLANAIHKEEASRIVDTVVNMEYILKFILKHENLLISLSQRYPQLDTLATITSTIRIEGIPEFPAYLRERLEATTEALETAREAFVRIQNAPAPVRRARESNDAAVAAFAHYIANQRDGSSAGDVVSYDRREPRHTMLAKMYIKEAEDRIALSK